MFFSRGGWAWVFEGSICLRRCDAELVRGRSLSAQRRSWKGQGGIWTKNKYNMPSHVYTGCVRWCEVCVGCIRSLGIVILCFLRKGWGMVCPQWSRSGVRLREESSSWLRSMSLIWHIELWMQGPISTHGQFLHVCVVCFYGSPLSVNARFSYFVLTFWVMLSYHACLVRQPRVRMLKQVVASHRGFTCSLDHTAQGSLSSGPSSDSLAIADVEDQDKMFLLCILEYMQINNIYHKFSWTKMLSLMALCRDPLEKTPYKSPQCPPFDSDDEAWC